MIPLLLRPRLLSLKNRWKSANGVGSRFGRDFVVVLFSVIVISSLYQGSYALISSFYTKQNLIFVGPDVPLGLLFLILFFLLFFTSLAACLGSLFMARDLDLLLTSPLKPWRFFCARTLDVLIYSSWMALVFCLPVIKALADYFEVGLSFYLLTFVLLVPFFLIPIFASQIVLFLVGSFLSARRTRDILVFLFSLFLLALLLAFRRSGLGANDLTQSSTQLLAEISTLSISSSLISPASWVANPLSELLMPSGQSLAPYLGALFGFTALMGLISYILFRVLYAHSYSNSRSSTNSGQVRNALVPRVIRSLTPFLDQRYRALFAKEFRLFARDMTQAIQLIMLIGLCLVYLYNFRILNAVNDIPGDAKLWWQALLVLANLIMGSLVTTAVCARFVYPSVSLEGQSFWILKSSPLATQRMLSAKFWFWLIPIGIISAVIMLSGALAIQAEPQIIATSAFCAFILCYGIVGLGVGLGAFFANFEWEYSAQLTSNLGNLIYMLSSAVFIFINLIPISLLIILRTLRTFGFNFSPMEWYAAVGLCATLIVYSNFSLAKIARRIGAESLDKKYS